MDNLYWKVKAYLEANGKTIAEFEEDKTTGLANIRLVHLADGLGNRIGTWNVSGLAEPTDEQLTALDAQATTDFNNNRADKTRRRNYGEWRDQLDEIYHDIDAWKARLQQIKTDNPKG
ncbi:protein XkdW [uncultured Mediterranean phage]|nr:protein XkdW [uncultured Mediterranean phage]